MITVTDIAVKATEYQMRNGAPPHGAEVCTTDYRELLESLLGARLFGVTHVKGRTGILSVGGVKVYANDAVPEGEVWLLVPR